MRGVANESEFEKTRILLGLLESVERGGKQSQRLLASELGIALGLVNAYLKRCVSKGLVKVSEAPAHRYAYYLTPHGFAEKSRLTVEYLTCSFSLFRRAKRDCAHAFEVAQARGFSRIALLGMSDLAEIAAICALNSGVTISAIVDMNAAHSRFVGLPLVKSLNDIEGQVDAVVVTDLMTPAETISAALRRLGTDRVLVPALLGTGARDDQKEVARA
jgi:DNA-binding MarR family transcriptional regulator